MNHEHIINTLNFSGDENSWFDLWHSHLDWDGDGNQSWENRNKYLAELVVLYYGLSEKLKDYPHPFQLWIMIDENDSAEDAVYIHTPNPNSDNFPIQSDEVELPPFTNSKLERFIHKQGLSVKGIMTQEGNVYYLFDESIGVPL